MSTVYQGVAANVTAPLAATITGATNATPIVIQTSAAHGFQTGDQVDVALVTGNTAANNNPNNPWTIIVPDSTHFSLTGSVGSGAWVSGGTATNRSLTPATTIPSDGDARNAASVNVPIETALDRTQFLAQRLGKYRFLNAYQLVMMDDTFTSYSATTINAIAQATVSGATNVNPIQITTSAPHGYTTGDTINVIGVGGTTAANGTWVVTVTGANTFTVPIAGNGAYTAGGNSIKAWSALTSMSGLLTYGVPTLVAPVCNFGDILEIGFCTTMTCATSNAAIGLGFDLAGGAYQFVPGSAQRVVTGYNGAINLSGFLTIGSANQPLNSGSNNQLFNFAVMGMGYTASNVTMTLFGHRQMTVKHYRAN